MAILLSTYCAGQDTPAAPPTEQKQASDQSGASPSAPPAPLPTPAITGPLQASPPINIEAGALGKYSLNGVVSGIGLFQNNPVPGNNTAEGAFSNAQLFFQKTDGWFQFYVQAGAYDIVSLGTPFISNATTNSDLYGPVPTVYAKLVPGKNTNILIGILPTIMGAE